MPIARSLCINYPFDPLVYENTYQYQFLFGDAFLVVPITSLEKTKKLYFPKGDWYDVYRDVVIHGGTIIEKEFPSYEIPLYARASSIIPMQHKVQSTKEPAGDTLFLHVYYGNEKNVFAWYDDDGSSLKYQKGDYCLRNIEFNPQLKKLVMSAHQGTFKSGFKWVKFILHGFPETGENGSGTESRKQTAIRCIGEYG
jgi:alpha-glucosidase